MIGKHNAVSVGSIALLITVLLGGLAVGGVAAADSVPYTVNKTADSDTTNLRVTAENISGTESASVTVYEVSNPDDPANRSTSQVATGTLDTSSTSSSTDTYSYSVPDISDGNTTTYEVEITGESADSYVVERLGVLGGGGGGLLGGGIDSTTLGGLALVLVVLAWAAREEM